MHKVFVSLETPPCAGVRVWCSLLPKPCIGGVFGDDGDTGGDTGGDVFRGVLLLHELRHASRTRTIEDIDHTHFNVSVVATCER